jgi:amidophosphoribosyltransferase
LESAKEAILNGVAGEKELELVAQGAIVNSKGQVVPEYEGDANGKGINGDANGHARRKREREESGTPPVRDREDIRYVYLNNKIDEERLTDHDSLHNFANEPDRGYE